MCGIPRAEAPTPQGLRRGQLQDNGKFARQARPSVATAAWAMLFTPFGVCTAIFPNHRSFLFAQACHGGVRAWLC